MRKDIRKYVNMAIIPFVIFGILKSRVYVKNKRTYAKIVADPVDACDKQN